MLEEANQGTQTWFEERAGHVTASCFCDVIAVRKKDGAPLKARQDYLMKLVGERLTGKPAMGFSTAATTWGTESESVARREYEIQTGELVREVGFKKHPTLPWVGASSDGLVGEKGGTQFKCPFNSSIHLQTILTGMPEEHLPQVQGEMWVLSLDWIDFVSYDPRMPPQMQIYIQRIQKDLAYHAMLEDKVTMFLQEIEETIQQISYKCCLAA